MWNQNYFVYITTNPSKTVLYTGVTNDLAIRMKQHFDNRGNGKTFAGKYFCYNLVYWERHNKSIHAIEREKQIKGWVRTKKEQLIKEFNPEWKFLNEEV
ncbi:MAG TPA: GIY-YIG nuclease family protein [Bacteroidia bacterium]|nr:GIY-YIG nuclease family protein [Bacteroidia bacterium]HNU34550.1 GIY-YIG nuclease family protein [Bacteroidia bacterium]